MLLADCLRKEQKMKDNDLLLSIIVPVYKTEQYLKKCVDSILTQKYQNYELILVDDGSPDRSGKICDEYAEKDTRVKVIHKQNGGLVSARISGLQIARGDYVGYVDSDDWIDADYFLNMMNIVKNNGDVDIVCSLYTEAYDTVNNIPPEQVESGIYCNEKLSFLRDNMMYKTPFFNFGIYPSVWSKITKRNILEKFQSKVPQGITLGEDSAVTYPMILNGCKTVYVLNDNLGYYYRQSANSMVHKYNPKLSKNVLQLINYLEATLKNSNHCFLENKLMYYAMIVKWVIGNEINSGDGIFTIAKRVKEFRDNKIIDNFASRLPVDRLPLSVKVLIQLFIKGKCRSLTAVCKLYKFFVKKP